MKHMTLPRFWRHYQELPKEVQNLADKNFQLLKADPYHSSLHFKKVGKQNQLWSVRVSRQYRALGREKPEGIVWFWIGSHGEYDKLLKGS
ncbi:hypothetical protein MNBD_CHLOROFLEXI01-1590 [hydrothermal vent metagenome]|uniref:ParE-like toxin domain-containing protein n=1 Tax=hydrothermal vent metagenome TaxID=652676 RepID=A0A3B0VMD5_9ZZZZ